MMQGRTLLAVGVTAVTIVLAGVAFAQAPGNQPGAGAETKASKKPGTGSADSHGAPMGPGMMGQPGVAGPGQMGYGRMGDGQMGYSGMGPGRMGAWGMGPGMMGYGRMGYGMMGRRGAGAWGMGPGMMGYGRMGYGMMGRRGMGYWGMGPWMTGPGIMGYGMMGPHGHYAHSGMMMGPWAYGRRTAFSADDLKRIVDGQLARRGFKHLKVGTVKIVDDNTAIADIVTKEGSLAVRLRVDRNTGFAVIEE